MKPIDHRSRAEQEAIRERQRKEASRTDEFESPYVMTRSADFGIFARTAYFLDRYKLIWYLIFTAILAIGFDFKTPAQHYNELRDRIVALETENQKAEAGRVRLDKKLDALLIFQCLSQSERDLLLAGMDCSKMSSQPKVQVK